MEKSKLIAKKREIQGSAEVRRLRRDGILPAVIYSEGTPGQMVQLDTHTFKELIHHHGGESMMVDVEVEGDGTFPVLVKDVQHNAVTGDLLHVDLYKVSMTRAISVEIPVVLVGDAKGVVEGGLLEHLQHTVAVECLPADLLDSIEVDVSELNIGDMITINDLVLDRSKYTLLTDGDAGVVAVAAPRVVEEDEEEGAEGAEGEPEVISEKKEEADD
ncbi:MAG: 50S ribosomal protein L25 [Kiritimatiellales bacterium]|nr:50S ribosomal protein L25 [Kiritimatiellales bacterium]